MGETERATSIWRSGFSLALCGRGQDGQELAAEAAPTRAGVGPSLEVVTHVRPGPGKEVALDVIHPRREQDRHARRIADERGDGAGATLARLGGAIEETVLAGMVLRPVLTETAGDLYHGWLSGGKPLAVLLSLPRT